MNAKPVFRAALTLLAAAGTIVTAVAPAATAAQSKNPTSMHVVVQTHDVRTYFSWKGTTAPAGELHYFVDNKQIATLTVPTTSQAGVARRGYKVVVQLPYTIPSGATHKVEVLFAGDVHYAATSQVAMRSDPRIVARPTSKVRPTRYDWYRAPVSVDFTCVATTGAVSCPKPVRFGHSGANQYSVGVATAADGGRAAVAKVVNIDSIKPMITIDRSRGTYQCTDALSGIAHCTLARFTQSGAAYFRVTAVDRAGNAALFTGRL